MIQVLILMTDLIANHHQESKLSVETGRSNAKSESAKLRTLRAHVPMCSACFRAHVPTCVACLRAHVPTCLMYLRAQAPTCLACLLVHVPTCLAYSLCA